MLNEGGSGPDPEVEGRAKRRRFSAEYKARILREADGCSKSGEIGALLRREGLYASHLITWRRQREKEGVAGLSRKRGRKANPEIGLARKNAQLEAANRRLNEKLRKAEIIIEFQKKWPSCGRHRRRPTTRRPTDERCDRSITIRRSFRGMPGLRRGAVVVLSTAKTRRA